MCLLILLLFPSCLIKLFLGKGCQPYNLPCPSPTYTQCSLWHGCRSWDVDVVIGDGVSTILWSLNCVQLQVLVCVLLLLFCDGFNLLWREASLMWVATFIPERWIEHQSILNYNETWKQMVQGSKKKRDLVFYIYIFIINTFTLGMHVNSADRMTENIQIKNNLFL